MDVRQISLVVAFVSGIIASLDLIVAARIIQVLYKSRFSPALAYRYLERYIKGWEKILVLSTIPVIAFSMEGFLILPLLASVMLAAIHLACLELLFHLLRRRYKNMLSGRS